MQEMSMQEYELFNHEWLLIVDEKGVLRRLNCPFRALLLVDVEFFKGNQIYLVTAVVLNQSDEMMYAIKGHVYYYYYFIIIN